MNRLLLLIIFSCIGLLSTAQNVTLKGEILDEKGKILPFANIALNDGSQGTVSNDQGMFSIQLRKGKYELQAFYVGFERKSLLLNISQDTFVSIQLSPQVYQLQNVIVTADQDPAKRIIKNVIEKRKQYLRKSSVWEAKSYIKGSFKMVDAPQKFMGVDIGGIDSVRAMNESMIIYLSEIQSTLTIEEDKVKETIHAAKTSGFSNVPSLNTGVLININLYENSPVLFQGKSFVSPVANQALSYYNYSYLGARISNGNTIHSIKLKPKRAEEPSFQGIIEIVDSSWMIESFRGIITGSRINYELVDTVNLTLAYKEGAGFNYLQKSDVIIKANLFGFGIKGGFTGQFTHQAYQTDQFTQSFDDVFIAYDSSAYDKDSTFWKEARTIALTEEEESDYFIKDSIYELENDSLYLDTLRRRGNRYDFSDHLARDYTYTFADFKTKITVNGLLNNSRFNPVQGYALYEGVSLSKTLSENLFKRKYWKTWGNIGYGFSDRRLRYDLGFKYTTDDNLGWLIEINGGYQIKELNRYQGLSLQTNTFANLFFKKHFSRLYNSGFVNMHIAYRAWRDWKTDINILWEDRKWARNHTHYSLINPNRPYPINFPNHRDLINFNNLLGAQQALVIQPRLKYQPGNRYIILPDSKLLVPSKWPIFTISSRIGVPVASTTASFWEAIFAVEYSKSFGVLGESNWYVQATSFLSKDELSFYDYRHFNGNLFFISDGDYRKDFMMMPLYEYSTEATSLQMHWEHGFNGFIFNKIPLLRKTGFEIVTKVAYLNNPEVNEYTELSVAIDKIGYKFIRPLRVDFVWNMIEWQAHEWGVVVGFNLPFTGFVN